MNGYLPRVFSSTDDFCENDLTNTTLKVDSHDIRLQSKVVELYYSLLLVSIQLIN